MILKLFSDTLLLQKKNNFVIQPLLQYLNAYLYIVIIHMYV